MDVASFVPSLLTIDNNATYSCTLTNTWSAANHPVGYDAIRRSAHWSPPVLVAHAREYELWTPNTLASSSIELVAELGVTGGVESDLNTAEKEGLVGDFVIGEDQFNAIDPPQIFEEIQFSQEFPMFSTISMIAPSPDWFTGIPNFAPFDNTLGVWYESFEIATGPWDAGTEMGETYSINNDPEPEQLPISQITPENAPSSGILLDPTGTTILPMATWSCLLQQGTTEDPVSPLPDVFPDPLDGPDLEAPEEIIDIAENSTSPSMAPTFIGVDQDEESESPSTAPTSKGDDDEEENNDNNGVCGHYFADCVENTDCCSANCDRGKCGGRVRVDVGRSKSMRVGYSGAYIYGGAAGRKSRGFGRKLTTGSLRGFH